MPTSWARTSSPRSCSLSRESTYPGAPSAARNAARAPCFSCVVHVPRAPWCSLAARCSRGQPFLMTWPLPRRALAPGCSCLVLLFPPLPSPPSCRLSAHPRCVVSRRRMPCLLRWWPSVVDGRTRALRARVAPHPPCGLFYMLFPARPPLARDRGYASWCMAPWLASQPPWINVETLLRHSD